MKHLLFIAHRVPYPPDKGERVRAFHEIRALSQRFRVTVAALSHSRADAQAADGLRRHCHSVIVAPAGRKLGLIRGMVSLLAGRSVTEGFFHSRRLYRLLRKEFAARPVDLVLAYSSSMLPYALDVPAAARVMDLVDVDSAKWACYAQAARWPRSWLFRREADGVNRLERRAFQQCDAVLLVSQAEVQALGCRSEKVHAVGNGVDAGYFAPQAVEPVDLGPAGLIFTGTMDYRPNVEAVCWFAREVWPELKRDVPESTFTIAGRDPVGAVRRLARLPGVTVTGSVPDIRPFLAAASVAVCPLHIARGIQNKILEAMAMAKVVVASPAAIEGLDLQTGRHLLRAESPPQWRRHIRCLLGSSRDRAQLGRAARQCILESYTWPARMAPLVTLCEKLCDAGISADAEPPGNECSREEHLAEGRGPALVGREEGAAPG